MEMPSQKMDIFTRHVKLKDFKLEHDSPEDFVHSVLFVTAMPYAACVSCMLLYTVTMVFYSALNSVYGSRILIWLTYWSFYILTARVALTAINAWVYVFRSVSSATRNHEKTDVNEAGLPVVYKIQWLLQNTSACSALIVSILYWTILFSGDAPSMISVNSHGINSIFILIDLLLSRAPVRVQHFIYTVIFFLVYVLFTIVYWAAGGRNHKGDNYIYFVLDYADRPGLAVGVIAGIVLVVVPLIQTFLYGVYRLRQWFVCRWGRDRTVEVAPCETPGKKSPHFSSSRRANKRLNDSANSLDSARSHRGSARDVKTCFVETNYVAAPDNDPEAVIDVDLDFEMDEIIHPRPFQPRHPLLTSELSTTESTKALLA